MNDPASLADFSALIREQSTVAIQGGGSKPGLSKATSEAFPLRTKNYSGIIEYQPSEYTVSVKAGTSLEELESELAKHGQYLPFEPGWINKGATVGGTIAANAAGPGRVRFGGVRDFVIGVTLIDGAGRLLRGGGKVVKNAAGFDLPKFVVGSMGRLALIAEATFKVFPRPTTHLAWRWSFTTHQAAVSKIAELARSPFETTGIEYDPSSRSVFARLGGEEAALVKLAKRVGGEPDDTPNRWLQWRNLDWADVSLPLIRVPTRLGVLPKLLDSLQDTRSHVSAGGDCTWINPPDVETIDKVLRDLGLTGLNHAAGGPLWIGKQSSREIDRALQDVFDPDHRFSGYG